MSKIERQEARGTGLAPQPLGILPTRFILDEGNRELASPIALPLAGLITLVVLLLGLPPVLRLTESFWTLCLVLFAGIAGTPYLALGLVEKYVRRRALRRTRTSESIEDSAERGKRRALHDSSRTS